MDEDLDLVEKPRTAKRGRRADAAPNRELTTIGLEEEVKPSQQQDDRTPPPRPAKKSRRGGWGEETSSKRPRDFDDARFDLATPRKEDEDSDNDIPVIPDLEEYQEDDLTAQIAMAPTNVGNRVATYLELDNDLLRHATFLTLDNETDLKLLAKGLCAESEVMEEDKHWDWDRLFTEVASELTTEWEQANKAEAEA